MPEQMLTVPLALELLPTEPLELELPVLDRLVLALAKELVLEQLVLEPLPTALLVLEQLVPELAGDKAMELPAVNREPVSDVKHQNSNYRH